MLPGFVWKLNDYHSYDYSFNKFRNCGYINRDVNLLKQLFIPTHPVNMLGMSLAILIALLLRYISSLWILACLKQLRNIVSPPYYVQIPGERSLGTFNLDILNDDVHVSLPSTSEVNDCLQIWLAFSVVRFYRLCPCWVRASKSLLFGFVSCCFCFSPVFCLRKIDTLCMCLLRCINVHSTLSGCLWLLALCD